MSQATRVRVATDLEELLVDDEVCLLAPRDNQLLVLNDSARSVWDLLCADGDVASTVRRLAERLGLPAESVAAHVHQMVADLVDHGVLIVVDDIEAAAGE